MSREILKGLRVFSCEDDKIMNTNIYTEWKYGYKLLMLNDNAKYLSKCWAMFMAALLMVHNFNVKKYSAILLLLSAAEILLPKI